MKRRVRSLHLGWGPWKWDMRGVCVCVCVCVSVYHSDNQNYLFFLFLTAESFPQQLPNFPLPCIQQQGNKVDCRGMAYLNSYFYFHVTFHPKKSFIILFIFKNKIIFKSISCTEVYKPRAEKHRDKMGVGHRAQEI